MVMSTVVIVVTLSLTGMAYVRVQRKVTEMSGDMQDARAGASAGVEYAATWIAADPTWRTSAASLGGALPSVVIGRCTVQVTVTDPIDGVLINNLTDPIDVIASASIGAVNQVYQARLTPTQVPLSSLNVGTAAGNSITLTNAVVLGTDRVHSNVSVLAANSRVKVPAQAVGTVLGTTFYSGATGLVSSLQMPDALVFDYYRAIGTEINGASLAGKRLENVVLSPQSNPYGVANARGVYWIDLGGNDYTVQNCRIVGTLVLLNCGAKNNSVIGSGVTWEAASSGMPALLVQGAMAFTGTADRVSEATIGINLNPTGTPSGGVANATKTDTYPARIRGLVYVSLNADISGETAIDGQLIVGNKLNITGSLSVIYDDACFYSPPPGFRAATIMTLVPGSFVRVVH